MLPFITIITPTIQRESLKECCRSLDRQTFTQWEHIVVLDVDAVDYDLVESVCHSSERLMIMPGRRFGNYGNTARNRAWKYVRGRYVLYCDDDNYLADHNVLQRIYDHLVQASEPDWAIFPILRHGQRFFSDPPGNCMTDTANMVIKREIAQWPDGPEYTMDGLFCDQLKAKYAYAAFPATEPIVVMEKSSLGL